MSELEFDSYTSYMFGLYARGSFFGDIQPLEQSILDDIDKLKIGYIKKSDKYNKSFTEESEVKLDSIKNIEHLVQYVGEMDNKYYYWIVNPNEIVNEVNGVQTRRKLYKEVSDKIYDLSNDELEFTLDFLTNIKRIMKIKKINSK